MGTSSSLGILSGVLQGLNRSRRLKERRAQEEFDNSFDRIRQQIAVTLGTPNADPQAQNQALATLLEELDEIENVREKSIKGASPFRKIAGLFGAGKKKQETELPEISPEDVVSGVAPPEALIPPPDGEQTGAEFGRPAADFPPVGGMPVGEETQTFPGGGPGAAITPTPPEFGPGRRGVPALTAVEQFKRASEGLRAVQEEFKKVPPGQTISFETPFGGAISIAGVTPPTSREQLSEQTSQIALSIIDPNASPEEREEAIETLRRLGDAERAERQEPQLAGSFQAVASNVAGKIISTREEFEALPAEQQKEILKRVGQEKPPPASQQALDLRKKVGKAASRVLNAVRAALLPGAQGEEKRFSDEGIELFKEGSVTGEGGQLGRTRVRKTPQEIASELIQTFGFSDQFFRENSAAIEAELLRLLRQQGGGGLSAAEAFAQVFGSR